PRQEARPLVDRGGGGAARVARAGAGETHLAGGLGRPRRGGPGGGGRGGRRGDGRRVRGWGRGGGAERVERRAVGARRAVVAVAARRRHQQRGERDPRRPADEGPPP